MEGKEGEVVKTNYVRLEILDLETYLPRHLAECLCIALPASLGPASVPVSLLVWALNSVKGQQL